MTNIHNLAFDLATKLGCVSVGFINDKVTFSMFFDKGTKQKVDSNLLEAKNLLSELGYKRFSIMEDDGLYKVEASK